MVQRGKKVAENTILNARIIVPMVKEKSKHERVPLNFQNAIYKWYKEGEDLILYHRIPQNRISNGTSCRTKVIYGCLDIDKMSEIL